MSKGFRSWGAGLLAGTAMLMGAAGWQTSAFAGSDNSSDTYAADYSGMGAPAGTFVVFDYIGWRHADEFIQNNNNILAKFGFPKTASADISLWTDIARLTYFSSLWNHPLIFSVAVPAAFIDKAVINGGPFGGPQTFHDGIIDPAIFVTYGLIVDPTVQRYLGFTTYLHLPANNYNAFKLINVSTPNQWTVIPQVGYSEGLTKFGLNNLWFDFIANASIHSDGKNPAGVDFPGLGPVQYNKLTQDNSYDVKAFLRYNIAPAFWIAAGVEKSWGGNQIVSGGSLGALIGPTSLGLDDFLKGHIQASFPLAPDFHVAADITHDFERNGGAREDITAELKFTKLFLPDAPLK